MLLIILIIPIMLIILIMRIILIMLIIPILLVHSPIYIPQVHGNMCVVVCVLSSFAVVIFGTDPEQACVCTNIEQQTLNANDKLTRRRRQNS